MAIELDTLETNTTVPTLRNVISQKEALGFELSTLARGVVNGKETNTATLRILDVAGSPGPIILVEVSINESLPDQEVAHNTGPNAGKRLISYAAVFVQGKQTNVAVYRG